MLNINYHRMFNNSRGNPPRRASFGYPSQHYTTECLKTTLTYRCEEFNATILHLSSSEMNDDCEAEFRWHRTACVLEWRACTVRPYGVVRSCSSSVEALGSIAMHAGPTWSQSSECAVGNELLVGWSRSSSCCLVHKRIYIYTCFVS